MTVADDVSARCRHLPQRRDCRLGAFLLDVTKNRIQQHDRADRDRIVGQRRVTLVKPERKRRRGRDQQQNDEDVAKLTEEFSPGWNRPLGGELIRPIATEPGASFVVRQATKRVTLECANDVFGRLLVGGRHRLTDG